MTRAQRIDYEILDCVLKANFSGGLITDAAEFSTRLRLLFSDINPAEFIAACLRLRSSQSLALQKFTRGSACQGSPDDPGFFVGTIMLAHTAGSRQCFRLLGQYIEIPTLKRPAHNP